MDMAILRWIQEVLGSPAMDSVMPIATMFGEHGIFWIAVGLALTVPKQTRRWGLTLLITMLIAWLIGEHVVKPLVGRPRPFIADPSIALLIKPPSGASFPSGHTLTSFCCATVIALSTLKRPWKVAAWIVAALVAFSRLYLFAHYPTDVLVGALWGVFAALVGVWISNRIANRWQHREKHSATSPDNSPA